MNAVPDYLNQHLVSEQDYLNFSQNSEEKCEYIHGEIVAMAGASKNHNLISLNLTLKLGAHLQGDCVPFASDWRVKCEQNYYYPDLIVDCDTSQNHQAGKPLLIIEILSDSTRENDLTVKLRDYQKIPSLQEYMLVEQGFKRVVVYRKKQNWQATEYFAENDEIDLESIDFKIDIHEIYHRVIFDKEKFKIFRQSEK